VTQKKNSAMRVDELDH